MMTLKVLVIAVVLGEGGSGGALGIGVADRAPMLEDAYYPVISPEGYAAILWKHRKHAPEATRAMKLVAPTPIAPHSGPSQSNGSFRGLPHQANSCNSH